MVTLLSSEYQRYPADKRPLNLSDDAMLAQSISGLAAQAVNENRGDEMVYIDLWDNRSYHRWRNQLLSRTGIEDRGTAKVWNLVARYHKQGIVAGYILYDDQLPADNASGSVNVATSLAGILRGVIVSERQEAAAKRLKLPLLLDVRGKTEAWCFENYRDRLNRKQLLLQRPDIPNNRAIAIAHRSLTICGESELAERVYPWLDAPALIHGWNSTQDEGASVRQISGWGHVLCPSDWAINLPALSISSQDRQLPRFVNSKSSPSNTPRESNVDRNVAFVLTDGDNLQWVLGDFAWNKKYWASPQLGEFPFGFGLPIAELMEVAPDAYLYLQRTQPERTSVIVSPGYVFVDHLGTKLKPKRRRELLNWYATRIENVLQRSGLKSIILICDKLDHPRTQEAGRMLAAAAPSLSAVFAMQYAPYEAGEGRIWQFDRPHGTPLPFVSASYSLWSQANRQRAGTPTEVAGMINRAKENRVYHRRTVQSSWVAVHAWSEFQKSKPEQHSDDVAGEGNWGAAAAAWCEECLEQNSRVVSPGELVAKTNSDRQAESKIIKPTLTVEAKPLGSDGS